MTSAKKYTVIAILILIVLSVVMIYLYREYHRKPADLSSVTPEIKTDVYTLINDYNNDEDLANKKYLGKIVEVFGPVVQMNDSYDSLINISLGDESDMHKVSCMLDKKYLSEAKLYRVGEPIRIKGICTGFLIDVELNRCVIVKQKAQ